MSISQNFPEEGPTLNLNFAGSKVLDPRITFARPSTLGDATYMDANGLIRYAGPDEPRFDHRYEDGEIESLGLLVEEQRQNLFFYNTKHDESYWKNQNSSETINTTETLSPDGTNNATKLFGDNGVTKRQSIYQGVSVTSGTTYTFSVFLKQGERRYATMWFDSSNVSEGAFYGSGTIIDLQTGTRATGNQTTIVPYPNGWYRCYVTATPTATQTMNMNLSVGGPNNNNGAPYDATGDGSSGIYIWGHQLEARAFPTSYIPTSSSQATRSPDEVSMTGTNFSDWYNQNEGTIYCSGNNTGITTTTSRFYYAIEDTSNSSGDFIRKWIWNGATGLLLNSFYTSNTTGQGSVISAEFNNTLTTDNKKTAVGYAKSDFASYYNGTSLNTDTSGNLPVGVDRIRIGTNLSGHISQLTYYPTRLSNTVLQNLTK